MADVFISYSRRDARFVGALADELRRHGKDVWIDIEGIRDAEVFPVALRNAIASSNGFVFVISPASVRSSYCQREVEDAVEAGKRIVPVDLERTAEDLLPEAIRVRNWIPASDDLDATAERVVTALDTDLDHLKAHTQWELKAVEWEEKDREHSLLLRGAELSEADAWLLGAEAKDPAPTPLQREYVTASRQAEATRQRRVTSGAVIVALVSVALLVFALIQRAQAQNARTTNKSRAIAFASEAQTSVDPERAVLMAMAATRSRATPDALFALRGALDADPLLRRLPPFGAQNCQQPSPGISFSPEGVLAAGLCNGRIVLVGPNGRVKHSIRQPDPAAPLRFNPNGLSLAVAGNHVIRIFDAHTLDYRRQLQVPGYAQRLVFSGDGTRLAASSSSAKRSWTSVWDTRTGRLTMRRSAPAPNGAIGPVVRGIGFVSGGDALAVGSPTEAVTILASDGGRTLRTLPDKEDALIGVDPDGRNLVVGGFHTSGAHSREGVVTLWDTWTWRHPRIVVAAEGLRPRNIVVSRDGTRVAVGWSDGSAAVYSLQVKNQLVRFLGPPKPVSQLDYSPDSQTVAVGAADGSVRVWRTGGAERAYNELGSRIDWDPTAVSNDAVTVVTRPGLVRQLKLPGLLPVSTWYIHQPRHARFTYAWLGPGGDIAVMIRSDDRADVWDLRSQRLLLSLPALQGALAAIDNQNRRMILLDGQHNELVDLRTGSATPIRERARFCRGSWRAARFSVDGSIVVAGANCGEVFVWNARTAKVIRHTTLLGQITGLALSHDKRTLALASPDGRLVLIDLATGAQRAIAGAPRGITSLDFGAGDRLLAAGAADMTVRVWDVADERLLRELPLQAAAVARFTPNGKSLIATELTGVLRVFSPCPACEDAHALLAEGTRRATRQLTPAERQTYLSGF